MCINVRLNGDSKILLYTFGSVNHLASFKSLTISLSNHEMIIDRGKRKDI